MWLIGLGLLVALTGAYWLYRVWHEGSLADNILMTAGRVFSAVFVIAAGVVLMFGVAHAAESGSSIVDFGAVLRDLTPALADLAVTILIGLALVAAAWLKKKWNIDIEAQLRAIEARHRETLHSAVQTWLGSAVDKFGDKLSFDVGSPSAAWIINGVLGSASDAVKHFKPSEEWILEAARSKLALSGTYLPAMPAPAQVAPAT